MGMGMYFNIASLEGQPSASQDFRVLTTQRSQWRAGGFLEDSGRVPGTKILQNTRRQQKNNRKDFLRENILTHARNQKISANIGVRGSANLASKGTSLVRHYPNSKRRQGNYQKQSENIRSHLSEDDELIMQNELELKIQEDQDKQKNFRWIQQRLENNRYKELQKLREKQQKEIA